jgi:hypothetical protein
VAVNITHTAVASGNSRLTAGDLADFAKSIPAEATVKVDTHSPLDQRDNHRWNIEAEWDETAQKNWTRPQTR